MCIVRGGAAAPAAAVALRRARAAGARRKALVALLAGQEDHYGNDSGPDTHFGHDVIPHALRDGMRVVAHHFGGYFRVPPAGPRSSCNV